MVALPSAVPLIIFSSFQLMLSGPGALFFLILLSACSTRHMVSWFTLRLLGASCWLVGDWLLGGLDSS